MFKVLLRINNNAQTPNLKLLSSKQQTKKRHLEFNGS